MEQILLLNKIIKSIELDIYKLSNILNEETLRDIVNEIVDKTYSKKYCAKCGHVLKNAGNEKFCIDCTLLKDSANRKLKRNKALANGTKYISSDSE